jgi:hypothetical protein
MFGFKGVGYDKEKRRYTAMIRTEGRSKRIGRFKTATEAARAYDRAALALRGPDWVTNQSMGLLP